MLMNHDFMSMQLHCSNRIPGFQDWMDEQDMTPVYASHRRQLQHLQYRCPVGSGWVLKSPQHLWSLDALLRVYPDARIVARTFNRSSFTDEMSAGGGFEVAQVRLHRSDQAGAVRRTAGAQDVSQRTAAESHRRQRALDR